MEQYLIHLNTMRRLEVAEILDVLRHLDKSKGDQIWLLGTKGSKRLVEDLNLYNPEQWKRAAELGLVYVLWHQGWAFAPDVDPATQLPVLMESYDDAFCKLQEPKAQKAEAPPAQLTLQEQPADVPAEAMLAKEGQATTQAS